MSLQRVTKTSLVASLGASLVLVLAACGDADQEQGRFTNPDNAVAASLDGGANCQDESDDEEEVAEGGTVLRQASTADAGDDEGEELASGVSTSGCTPSTPDVGVDLDVPPEPEEVAGASCAYPNQCKDATGMGSIKGDEEAEVKTREGTTSQWLSIRANEACTGVCNFGRAKTMRIRAQLTVPAGTNFDLYMYMNENSTTATCTRLARKSVKGGADREEVSIAWGETGTWADNADNSTEIRFEVRHVSGECGSNKKWKLTVFGNR